MGSDSSTRIGLVAHCCQGASYGFGLVVTVLTLAVMFWVALCYFGLTIVQISDTQRRAVVNYYTTPKPSSSPTSSLFHAMTIVPEETSINSIFKSSTTASVLRGSSRGEPPIKVDKKKDTPVIVSSLAKGDFAARDRPSHNEPTLEAQDSSISSVSQPRGPPRLKDETLEDSEHKAAILNGSFSEELEDDRIYARRVLPSGPNNRSEGNIETEKSVHRISSESETDSRLDILPTKVRNTEDNSGSSRRPQESEADRTSTDNGKTLPRDYIDRVKITPPTRDDISRSDHNPAYREPDFDREYPRRYDSDVDRDRGRSRYDDLDDERGSRSRYDKRDRGRDSDDRYSKGDIRVYPEGDRSANDERYRDRNRERYPDDNRRRGDDDRYDDRYRDYEERPRSRERDSDRKDGDRVLEDRTSVKDDRYRADDRYRSKSDDRYRSRDDDRYRSIDDDRYRSRDDERYRFDDETKNGSRSEERYRFRDDDRYKTRDADRYRDDDRYIVRDDDRYIARDDDKYKRDPIDRSDSTSGYKNEDRYRSRSDEERYVAASSSRTREDDLRKPASRGSSDYFEGDRRYNDERDRYRPRADEDRFSDISPLRSRDRDFRDSESRSSDLPTRDRKLSSSRSGSEDRIIEPVSDYDLEARDRSRSAVRDDSNPSRKYRPLYEEENYKNDGRIPSRYEEDDRRILPTRTIIEDSNFRSSLTDSRSKGLTDDARYTNDEKDSRSKDDRYYDQEDRIRSTIVEDYRGSLSRESSKGFAVNRDEFRTILPNERTGNDKSVDRREEAILDRRSYASEVGDDYRRKDSRRDYEYEERSRRPVEETRRGYRDEERYSERDRTSDEEYKREKIRRNYDGDVTRSRDRYVDSTRGYDDRYASRDEDRYMPRDDRSSPLPSRKYDIYPDEEERIRRRERDPEPSTMRKEEAKVREERPRSSLPSRSEDRYYTREEHSESNSPSRPRYDDDLSIPDRREYKDDSQDDQRHSSSSRILGHAKEPMIGSSMTSVYSGESSDVVVREKRFQNTNNSPQNSRVYVSDNTNKEKSYMGSGSDSRSRDTVRPLNAKDVIEAAMRHSDTSNQNERKVYYPVFDPRISNLTSPEIIRPGERRGTTITAKRKRST